jgi:hypothetical protein
MMDKDKNFSSEKSIDDKIKYEKIIAKDINTPGPTFEEVIIYSMDTNGAIDLRKLQSLEGRFGYNGGKGCDVLEGPCSCGAWHTKISANASEKKYI